MKHIVWRLLLPYTNFICLAYDKSLLKSCQLLMHSDISTPPPTRMNCSKSKYPRLLHSAPHLTFRYFPLIFQRVKCADKIVLSIYQDTENLCSTFPFPCFFHPAICSCEVSPVNSPVIPCMEGRQIKVTGFGISNCISLFPLSPTLSIGSKWNINSLNSLEMPRGGHLLQI